MSRVVLPWADDPVVSLIVTSHGKPELTCATLAAIASSTPSIYETIVVESDLRERAYEILARDIEGIDLVHCENRGFGYAQNLGVERARAPAVCILNNDLIPQPGWLEALLARLDDPTVGMVAPMLLFMDGTLQEAGVSMGSDGYPWRWGLGYAPDAPEVTFPREVDYGSACLLVRTEAFRAAGGFRPEYGMGYLEDSDLAVTIRGLGWRAIYEPKAKLAHALHATFGAERAERLSAENRPKFLARWGGAMADRPPLRHAVLHPAFTIRARDALATHRMLVVGQEPGWDDTTRALQRLLPDARVSALVLRGTNGHIPDDLAPRGVEVVSADDPASWLADRRGHADLVWVNDPAAAEQLEPEMALTQIQAAWLIRGETQPWGDPCFADRSRPPTVMVAAPARIEAARRSAPDARVFPEGTPVETLLAASGILVATS
jgi:GT2 family glycosyltransferase